MTAPSRTAGSGAPPRIVLYTKPGCHLCEEMRALLDEALAGTMVVVAEADISRNLETFVRFSHDIPVLEIDGREVARHRLTRPALIEILESAGIRVGQ